MRRGGKKAYCVHHRPMEGWQSWEDRERGWSATPVPGDWAIVTHTVTQTYLWGNQHDFQPLIHFSSEIGSKLFCAHYKKETNDSWQQDNEGLAPNAFQQDSRPGQTPLCCIRTLIAESTNPVPTVALRWFHLGGKTPWRYSNRCSSGWNLHHLALAQSCPEPIGSSSKYNGSCQEAHYDHGTKGLQPLCLLQSSLGLCTCFIFLKEKHFRRIVL